MLHTSIRLNFDIVIPYGYDLLVKIGRKYDNSLQYSRQSSLCFIYTDK